jgi:hypothetical protein
MVNLYMFLRSLCLPEATVFRALFVCFSIVCACEGIIAMSPKFLQRIRERMKGLISGFENRS